jgi:hypothetical protein
MSKWLPLIVFQNLAEVEVHPYVGDEGTTLEGVDFYRCHELKDFAPDGFQVRDDLVRGKWSPYHLSVYGLKLVNLLLKWHGKCGLTQPPAL